MRFMPALRCCGAVALAAVLFGCAAGEQPPATRPGTPDAAAVKRGEYLATAANCIGCHTDKEHGGAVFAGGGAVPTPFGTYYSRNITPDPGHGIGAWSDADFIHALRDGISPAGAHYFPAFPFTSFTNMTDADMRDIRAYLAAQQPAAQANKPHDVDFPFDMRISMVAWRALFFTSGPLQPDASQSQEWNRGRYLAEAVVHCGECHTPRNWLGAREDERRFSGFHMDGPGGFRAPNITPDAATGIGAWSTKDIAFLLATGLTPEGDAVGSRMKDVVEGTAKLTDSDRMAIALYVKSVPAVAGEARSAQ